MKIVFFGDSITDMCYDRTAERNTPFAYGFGYPFIVASNLFKEDPTEYEILNRGTGGNRIVDLYARIKSDVWNETPDVISILIGINDVWHEITNKNGVDIQRFEKIYSMIIEETLIELPNVRIMLLEPFFLKGSATESEYKKFDILKDYSKVVKKLSEKYNLCFVPLQNKFNEFADRFGVKEYLYDGIHPNVAGATLIADEWLKFFKKYI